MTLNDYSHLDADPATVDGCGVHPGTVERRRESACASPTELLAALPANVVLRRLPVPVLAVDDEGTVWFANDGFADLVGHQADTIPSMRLDDLLPHLYPARQSVMETLSSRAEFIVELRHAEGYTVKAKLSRSALLRDDDPIALVSFEDSTEQLWANP
jgi:PAS domain-containing protein